MKNKVYILGAGCSAGYGYPVAKEVVPQLEIYGQSLGGGATKLKQCIADTVELMRQQNVKTVDDLTVRLHTGAFDKLSGLPQASLHREERIWHAKLAMTALLLSREEKAWQSGLDGYHDLLLELCPGPGNWEQRFRRSSCSVLTFNNDRLFEMAFLRRNGPDLYGKLLYGQFWLNSGFSDIFNSEIKFADGGFCFLKLHGCVGRIVDSEEVEPCYRPIYGDIQPGERVDINDSKFFPTTNTVSRFRIHPLMVFPYEKQHIQSGERHAIYKRYITTIWGKAEELVKEADEIWVIGYSFHAMDRHSLMNLLSKATKCTRVIVQNINGEADRICKEMRLKHPELNLNWESFDKAF
jgi:hypothetical protein